MRKALVLNTLPVSILITFNMISVWPLAEKKGEKCCWLPQVRVPSDAKSFYNKNSITAIISMVTILH